MAGVRLSRASLVAGGEKTFTRIESYGDRGPSDLLVKLIEGWKERARPTGHDPWVEVGFRGRS
jgi:hypothetical protein